MTSELAFDPSEECIYVTQRGMARDRRPLYCIIKNIPSNGRSPAGELEIRCVDLWRDAFLVLEKGCSYTQFFDDPEHLRCKGCGLAVSKVLLRSGMVMAIRAVPPDYKVPRTMGRV
ncbi:hypothetical protein FRB99_005868 [Tulasnella sp. 403]|nr:hypothetical protein FRB99_005868 [Tulasnella sp. 403]